MENPILAAMGQQQTNNLQGAVQQAKQIMAGGNSPILTNLLSMCQGQDPKTLFYAECKRRGIEPNDILSLLK